MSDCENCHCDKCQARAWGKAVDREFGLIWATQLDGQNPYEASVLVGQIDDVRMLRELVVMFATSACCWWEQYKAECEAAEW
jgi:hypothetical protein